MLAGMHPLLTTDSVEPRHRLAYWTDMVCNTYVELECDVLSGADTIEGRISASHLATLQLSRVTATPQVVRRTASRIAASSEDYFLVSIQTQGEGRVSQDGRTALLKPGDFALYDSTRPYQLQFDSPFEQLVLRLPGRSLRTSLSDTGNLTASVVNGRSAAGHLMIDMLRSLDANIDLLAPESAAAVSTSVTQILIAGLSTLPGARKVPVSQLTGFHRQQIKSCITAQLGDPNLSVAQIARQLRLSPSTLHRAWAGEPCSIRDTIWALRLDAARDDLCNPAFGARTISAIAFSRGFNDAAHFSRAFRARFGCSPRALRLRTRSNVTGSISAQRPANPN